MHDGPASTQRNQEHLTRSPVCQRVHIVQCLCDSPKKVGCPPFLSLFPGFSCLLRYRRSGVNTPPRRHQWSRKTIIYTSLDHVPLFRNTYNQSIHLLLKQNLRLSIKVQPSITAYDTMASSSTPTIAWLGAGNMSRVRPFHSPCPQA